MPDKPRSFPGPFPWRRAATAAAAAALLGAAPAHAQGVAYEVAPVVTQLRWDDALGLSHDYLYGARLGVRFGPAVGLQGYYLTRSGLRFDPSILTPAPGSVPTQLQQELEVRSVGANLVVNLGSGSTVPFLRAGGGVLRLTPDGLESTDQILLRAGGGLRFNIAGGFGGEIFAEDWAFRVDRTRLFGGDMVLEDADADRLRHNLSIGASLNVPLGGDTREPGPGVRGTTIPIEPFGGRLSFADELGLQNQDVVGVRAGLDFNQLVGLRGFYWRGVSSGFDALEPIQGFGAEAQFNFGAGTGIFPYLVAGAGQLDFRSGYGDEMEPAPSNRAALILGAGAGITLSDRIRANVSIRDYIVGSQGTLEDVRRSDQLLHNPMLTAGLTFAVGGSAPIVPRLREDRERLQAETERLRTENERLRQQAERREALLRERDPQLALDVEDVVTDTLIEPRGQRVITLPVPERGEIYIRFGEPGGVRIGQGWSEGYGMGEAGAGTAIDARGLSTAELQQVIRQVVREEMQRQARLQADGAAAAATTDQQLAQMEARLAQRIDQIVSQRLAEQGRLPAQPGASPTVVVVPQETTTGVVANAPVYVAQQPHRLRPQRTRIYTGLNFHDATQLLLGARVNLGPITPRSPLALVPSVAVGLGGETSVMVAANLQFDAPSIGTRFAIEPHAAAGVGVLNRGGIDPVFNLGYGASALVGNTRFGQMRAFAEHQGIALFGRHRVLLGLQMDL